jgi:protein O-mannosyl-transferase
LAGKSDGLLSSSQLPVAVLGDRHCGCVASKVSIFHYWLVLVLGNACTRNRLDSGRFARTCRSLHLFVQIGLYLLATWTISDLSVSWRHQRQILGVAAVLVIAALTLSAWNQTSYWHDSESLWTHALAVNSNNDIAHNNLGNAALQKGQIDEAIFHFEKFVQLRPDHAETYYNLGNALLQKGLVDDAIAHFEKALKLNPALAEAENDLGNALFRKGQIDEAIFHFQKFLELCLDRGEKDWAEGHFNLGTALLQKGQIGEALAHFREAVKLRPDYAEAQNNLAGVLLKEGQVDEAILHYQKVLELRPDREKAHYNLGNALLQKGKVEEAIAHYEKALQIDPRSISALNQLAWVLATNSEAQIRNGAKAIELARQADQLSGGKNPIILHTLAAAYAESRQFSQAVETAQDALKLAVIEGNTAFVEALRQVIGLY